MVRDPRSGVPAKVCLIEEFEKGMQRGQGGE